MRSKFNSYSYKSLMLALVLTVFFSLGSVASAASMTWDFTQMNASQMTAEMGAGWNLGNTLDAFTGGTPNETDWDNPVVTKAQIQKVKALGFKTIRIPVTYMSKIGPAPNYTIDSAYLARVKEVVDYAYNEGLFVITNIHHDGSVSGDGTYPSNVWLVPKLSDQTAVRAKFQAVWQQIANTFVNYNEHLIFESMNEVFDGDYTIKQPDLTVYSNINTLNQIFVDTVRQTGGNNAARWLLIPGWNTNIDYTAGNLGYTGFALPTDNYRSSSVPSSEKRIMISVHYYAPIGFCLDATAGAATQWGSTADPAKKDTWGQEDFLESQFKSMYDKFVTQGYGVILGEYAAAEKSALDPANNMYRAIWAKAVVSTAKKYKLVPVWWDAGGSSKLFDRRTLQTTQQGIIDAIMSEIGTYYKIINRNSGKALDVSNGSTTDGAAVVQNTYTGSNSQQWELINVGLNNYELVNRNSGKPLEIWGWSTADGALADQWTYMGAGSYNQQWQKIDVGSGYSELLNTASNKPLDVFGWSTADGAAVGQWTLGDQYNFNQQWQLVPL